MKVFLKIKKLNLNDLQKPVLTYILLSVAVVSLFILLSACSERKAAYTAIPTTTLPTRQAPDNNSPTKTDYKIQAENGPAVAAAQVTTPVAQSNPATQDQNLANQATYRPVIHFSPEVARLGDSIEISGSGYPANTRLHIKLSTADLRTEGIYANVLTGEIGRFKTTLKLGSATKANVLTPGRIEVAVTTLDSRIGASAPLALQPALNTGPDEAGKNLVHEFFATFKRDTQSAEIYLNTNLRAQIARGKTSVPDLLGQLKTPIKVEVAKVTGTTSSYQATLYFIDGEQRLLEFEVATDVSGALRIAAIRIK
jgi:hypothetical protein